MNITPYNPDAGFYRGFAAAADITLAEAMLAWDGLRETTPGADDIEAGGYAAGLREGTRYYDSTHNNATH